jgi:hypothetical protein
MNLIHLRRIGMALIVGAFIIRHWSPPAFAGLLGIGLAASFVGLLPRSAK